MDEIRVDIKEMIERLRQQNREEVDTFAVDDSIDFLEYIDDSYADEKMFLVRNLIESDDDETLNFIICVLRLINNTIDDKIIQILADKCDMILVKKNNRYNATAYYILKYFSKQGTCFKSKIIPTLKKVIVAKYALYNRIIAFRILWEWVGFGNAVAVIRKGSYDKPENDTENK